MGAQESKAESIKYTTHSQDERLAFGTSCLQGWRPYMEDFHAAIPRLPNVTHSHYCPHPYVCIINPSKADAANGHPAAAAETEPKGISFSVSGGNTNKSKRPGAGQPTVHPSPYTFSGELFPAEEHYSFFGVYDGHRGNRVAHFISRRLHWKVAGEDSFREKNFPEAMRRGFISLDAELLQAYQTTLKGQDYVGSTGVLLLVTNEYKLYCASAGDSRCVLGSNGKAIPMSYDHKPEYPEEEARIRAAGGHVSDGRVNARLATSRSFGDFDFKTNKNTTIDDQVVTARPDVWERTVTEDDEFLILATDGIWDVLTSQAAINMIRYYIASGVPIHEVSEKILDRCIAVNPAVYDLTQGGGAGCDNMTVIIVALLRGKTMQQWQAMIAQRWAALEKPPIVEPKPKEPEISKSGGCLCCTYETSDGPPIQGRAHGDRPPNAAFAPQPQMQQPKAQGTEMAALGQGLNLDPKELEAILKRPMTLSDLNITFVDIDHKFPLFD